MTNRSFSPEYSLLLIFPNQEWVKEIIRDRNFQSSVLQNAYAHTVDFTNCYVDSTYYLNRCYVKRHNVTNVNWTIITFFHWWFSKTNWYLWLMKIKYILSRLTTHMQAKEANQTFYSMEGESQLKSKNLINYIWWYLFPYKKHFNSIISFL